MTQRLRKGVRAGDEDEMAMRSPWLQLLEQARKGMSEALEER